MNTMILYILCCFILLKTNNVCVLSADTRPFLNTYVAKGGAPFIVNVKSIINGKEKTCTGTILDKNWVLTLASCVPEDEDKANITVIANLNSYEGSSVNDTDLQERYITHVVVHPHYTPNKLGDADLALLQVQKPFEENEFVHSINIDVDGWPLDDGKPIKRTCGVIGFGDLDHTKRDTKLKIRRVQVTHSDDCPCARRNQWMNLVCLESVEDVGLCPQDDGAPLVCKEKIVGVNHMLVVRSNCSKTLVPQDICVMMATKHYWGDRRAVPNRSRLRRHSYSVRRAFLHDLCSNLSLHGLSHIAQQDKFLCERVTAHQNDPTTTPTNVVFSEPDPTSTSLTSFFHLEDECHK